jgi:hypothetical protein
MYSIANIDGRPIWRSIGETTHGNEVAENMIDG